MGSESRLALAADRCVCYTSKPQGEREAPACRTNGVTDTPSSMSADSMGASSLPVVATGGDCSCTPWWPPVNDKASSIEH